MDEEAARTLGLKLHVLRASTGRAFEPAWTKPRRVIAKVEWHPGELYPRVGFIVTNMSRTASGSLRSITSAGRASSGSRKARARSGGRGCRAGHLPQTRCGFSFM